MININSNVVKVIGIYSDRGDIMNTDVFDFMHREGPVSTYLKDVGSTSGHDYMKFEKGKDGRFTYMTGDEYIDRCINDLFKSTREAVVDNAITDYKVHEYAELMKRGVKFPPIYLDYVTGNQEGRHRALAFKEAFGADTKMPVFEIFPTKTNLKELQEYCQKKYGSMGNQFMFEYGPRLGFSSDEIYNYLGWDKPEEPEPEEVEFSELSETSDEELMQNVAEYFNMTTDELNNLPLAEYTRLIDQYIDKKYLS